MTRERFEANQKRKTVSLPGANNAYGRLCFRSSAIFLRDNIRRFFIASGFFILIFSAICLRFVFLLRKFCYSLSLVIEIDLNDRLDVIDFSTN